MWFLNRVNLQQGYGVYEPCAVDGCHQLPSQICPLLINNWIHLDIGLASTLASSKGYGGGDDESWTCHLIDGGAHGEQASYHALNDCASTSIFHSAWPPLCC